MDQNRADLSETQIEKLLLRALCQARVGDGVWTMVAAELKTYAWREPVHEAISRSLRDLRARKPSLLRELLPAALTRRGFPDVAWEEFLEPVNLTDEDARLLVQRLLAARDT